MDFLDPKKRRRHAIQLFVGYVLVATAIILATTTLIYYAYGFGITREGDLVHKGLVFVSSQPSGAELYVNNKRVENTNAKLNLASGDYTLRITREGYHDWSRNITVDGSSVDHYVYPLLIPRELRQEVIHEYDAEPRLVTQSPDRRWLMVQLAGERETIFDVYDLSRGQKDVGIPREISVPQELLTSTTGSARWELVEWSNNNRHALFRRHYTIDGAEKSEYILVDRQRPEGSYNLSRELNVDAATVDVTLFDKKPDTYYIHQKTTGELSKVDLRNPEPQRVLADVAAFKSHGKNVIVYVTAKDAPEGKVTAKLYDNGRSYKLRDIAAADVYLLDAARYDGNWYVVVGSQVDKRVFIYKDPIIQINRSADKKAGSLFALRVDQPNNVSFSANAQYIALQSRTAIHVYDIENEQAYRYDTKFVLDEPQKKMPWMDGNRFSYVSDGKQIMFDYDNINRRVLVPANARYGSAYDRNYKYLYTFTQRKDNQPGIALTATALRTEADL